MLSLTQQLNPSLVLAAPHTLLLFPILLPSILVLECMTTPLTIGTKILVKISTSETLSFSHESRLLIVSLNAWTGFPLMIRCWSICWWKGPLIVTICGVRVLCASNTPLPFVSNCSFVWNVWKNRYILVGFAAVLVPDILVVAFTCTVYHWGLRASP
jgi:hypothetical protein